MITEPIGRPDYGSEQKTPASAQNGTPDKQREILRAVSAFGMNSVEYRKYFKLSVNTAVAIFRVNLKWLKECMSGSRWRDTNE